MSDALDPVPPFSVDLLVVESVTGVTEARLDIETQSAEGPLDAVQAVVELFRQAVAAAMFSAGRDAMLEIERADASAGRLAQRWRVSGIDVGAYRVLLNLLDVVSLNGMPLSGLRLRSAGRSATAADRRSLMAHAYPRWPIPLPFELWLKQRLAGAKDVLIRFEFSRELSNDEFDAIEPLFVTWNHLITHGGYGNDVGEVELDDAIVCGETYMAAPDTLEHEFVCSVAHVAAFEAVVNMAIGVHRRLCTLKRVEIT